VSGGETNNRRFVLLDAIRGLAAIFVLFRHTVPYWGFGFYRSYLAVDLFFVLSGFVIAFAYDQRMRTGAMSLGQFLTARLIRMYPVYLVSLALCVVVWSNNLGQAAVPLAFALLFLPWPVPHNSLLFAVNGPYWSLFFELAANLLYGLARPLLSNLVLAGVLVLSGIGVVVTAFAYGNLDTGWQWGQTSIVGGFARSVFGVFVGLLLYRNHDHLARLVGRVISPWAAFLLVAIVLASPTAGDLDPVADSLVVLLVFPTLVLAASNHTGQRGRSTLLILGSASYPLYVLHQQAGLIVDFLTGGMVKETAPWSGMIFTALLILACVALEKAFDLPVRRWLRQRFLHERPSQRQSSS